LIHMDAVALIEGYTNYEKFSHFIRFLIKSRKLCESIQAAMKEMCIFCTVKNETDGTLVAFAHFEIHPQLRSVEVQNFLVVHRFARRGLGRKLVEYIRSKSAALIHTVHAGSKRWPLCVEVARFEPIGVLRFWQAVGLVEHTNTPGANTAYIQCAEPICNTCAKPTEVPRQFCPRCIFRSYCSAECEAASVTKCPTQCTTEIKTGTKVTDPVTKKSLVVLGELPANMTREKFLEMVNRDGKVEEK